MFESTSVINFNQVIDALQNSAQPFPEKLLRRFSDLSSRDLKALKIAWPAVGLKMKEAVLKDLIRLSAEDTLVNFDEFAQSILGDPDPSIRVLAIRLLAECDAVRLLPLMTDLMMEDHDEAVRAEAASHLGSFVLKGELDNLPENMRIANIQNLVDVASGNDLPSVRRRALESLGYSSNPKVHALIRQAFESEESLWKASALFAMGRSADDQWAPIVLKMLDSPILEVQYEAIRAAGELELKDAVEPLLAFLEDEETPGELRLAAIWALSQIGGEGVKVRLEELAEESLDDDELQMLDRALENLEMTELGELDLMDVESPDDDSSNSDEDSASENDSSLS